MSEAKRTSLAVCRGASDAVCFIGFGYYNLFCFGFLASQAYSPTRQYAFIFCWPYQGKNLKWHHIGMGS